MSKPLIILNPKAGAGKKKPGVGIADIPVIPTRGPNDATRIVRENLNKYDLFIAAGGDGTANEVGKALIGTDKFLGIIPTGSGNGLARELINPNIDYSAKKFSTRKIDIILINKIPSLNVAGTGFEAEVAHNFSKRKTRGFFTYIRATLRTFLKYKGREINIFHDEKISTHPIFSLSIANSKQYGNNTYISPLAEPDDGLFDVCIIKPFPLYYAPVVAYRLFSKTIHRSKYYQSFQSKKITILNEETFAWHIDGEPLTIKGPVVIEILENSLNVANSH